MVHEVEDFVLVTPWLLAGVQWCPLGAAVGGILNILQRRGGCVREVGIHTYASVAGLWPWTEKGEHVGQLCLDVRDDVLLVQILLLRLGLLLLGRCIDDELEHIVRIIHPHGCWCPLRGVHQVVLNSIIELLGDRLNRLRVLRPWCEVVE